MNNNDKRTDFILSSGLRRVGKYDTLIYSAYAGRGTTFDLRVTFELKFKLSVEKLQRAADKALRLYPELAVRPVISGGKLYYEENHSPVRVVSDEDGGYCFGSDGEKGTNGYLFIFMCGKKRLTFSWFHGLTDARGGIAFIATVLTRYISEFLPFFRMPEKLGRLIGMRYDSSEAYLMSECERYDPTVYFSDGRAAPSDDDLSHIFKMPPEVYSGNADRCRLINFKLSNDEIVRRVKAAGTSFAPYLACIAADAVRLAFDTGDKSVAVSNSIDTRGLFSTATLGNMAVTCPLTVAPEDFGLSYTERCELLSAQMKVQREKEYVLDAFAGFIKQANEFEAMGDIAEVNRLLTGASAPDLTPYTIALTYPGRVGGNPVSALAIRHIIPGMVTSGRGIVAYADRNEMTLQVSQRSDDLTLADALGKALEAVGLAFERVDLGRIRQNSFDYDEIKRI